MSEFCEHVEAGLGLTAISYETSKEIHAQGCYLCDQEALEATKAPTVSIANTSPLQGVNWRRVAFVAIFTFFLFNTGGLKACNPPPCHPLVPASCEP